jgi:hypothetical protein
MRPGRTDFAGVAVEPPARLICPYPHAQTRIAVEEALQHTNMCAAAAERVLMFSLLWRKFMSCYWLFCDLNPTSLYTACT